MSNSDCHWVAACGGTETPFHYKGKQYLFMWNKVTGKHSYYCLCTDTFEENLFQD